MTRREARRLALILICDELGRSLDVSDEWVFHPESDVRLTKDESALVRAEANAILRSLESRLTRCTRGLGKRAAEKKASEKK